MALEIAYQSGIYTLRSEQRLRGNLAEIWDFFSHPENLNKITPEDLKFKITTPHLPAKTYQGQIITYEIEILPMMKHSWVTEITLVKEKQLFIDEQRFGPYRIWHHEHHFEPLSEDEVKMTDLIFFKLPMGLLGRLVAGKMIKNKLTKIFSYRYQFCEKQFS